MVLMDELSEELKLKAELLSYCSFYYSGYLEQDIPYSKPDFKTLTTKEKKLCTAYVEDFVISHQNITFKNFIKEWVKKANLLWEDGQKIYFEGIEIRLRFDVHHYIAKTLIHELHEQLSTEKFEQFMNLKEYCNREEDLFQYKNLTDKQCKIFDNICVGPSKKALDENFENYIKYFIAVMYYIHEYINLELIISIIQYKARFSFNIKLTKKDIKTMANNILTEVLAIDNIQLYIAEKFLRLKEVIRYKRRGLDLLFDFTRNIFEAEKEFAKRGRTLAQILFDKYLIDEFIESDSLLKTYYKKMLVDSMEKDPISALEPEKDFINTIKFKNIDEIPTNNRMFKKEINFDNIDLNMIDIKSPNDSETSDVVEDEDYNAQIEEFSNIAKEIEKKIKAFEELVSKLPDLEKDGDVNEIIVPKEPVSNKVEKILNNIKNGTINPNTIYEDGRTLLINFIDYDEINEYERYLIINELIRIDCDVNLRDSANGQTPLYYAAQENKLHIARLLIKNGAEVDAIQTNTLQTPLHAAVGSGNVELVKLLLNNGADINSKSKTGTTAIVKAIMVYIMHINSNNNNPLSMLLTYNNSAQDMKETIDLLIERGADIDLMVDSNSGITIRELLEQLQLL